MSAAAAPSIGPVNNRPIRTGSQNDHEPLLGFDSAPGGAQCAPDHVFDRSNIDALCACPWRRGGAPMAGLRDERPTLSSVADRAHVSRQTVSNVLNSPHRVRGATLRAGPGRHRRARLPAAARRPADAQPPVPADRHPDRPVRDGIGGIVLDQFLHALSRSAEEAGCRLVLFTASDDERRDGGLPRHGGLLRRRRIRADVDPLRRPAHGLAPRPPAPGRQLRPAVGRTVGAAAGSTSTAPPAPGRRSSTWSSRGTSGSPSSAGPRGPAPATTGGPAGRPGSRRPAWTPTASSPACPTTRPPPRRPRWA